VSALSAVLVGWFKGDTAAATIAVSCFVLGVTATTLLMIMFVSRRIPLTIAEGLAKHLKGLMLALWILLSWPVRFLRFFSADDYYSDAAEGNRFLVEIACLLLAWCCSLLITLAGVFVIRQVGIGP
jgi:hypothetical protein